MHAARVAQDDVGRHELQQSIDARDGCLGDVESAKKREHTLGLTGPGGRDPELNFDGSRGVQGNGFETDAAGQQAVQVGIDSFGHANFEHGTPLRSRDDSMLPRRGRASATGDAGGPAEG